MYFLAEDVNTETAITKQSVYCCENYMIMCQSNTKAGIFYSCTGEVLERSLKEGVPSSEEREDLQVRKELQGLP